MPHILSNYSVDASYTGIVRPANANKHLALDYLATNQGFVGDHVTVERKSGGRAALTDSSDVGVNAL